MTWRKVWRIFMSMNTLSYENRLDVNVWLLLMEVWPWLQLRRLFESESTFTSLWEQVDRKAMKSWFLILLTWWWHECVWFVCPIIWIEESQEMKNQRDWMVQPRNKTFRSNYTFLWIVTKFLFAQPGTSDIVCFRIVCDIVCFRIVWYFLSLIFSVVYRRKLSSLTVEGKKGEGAEVWRRSFRSQSKCQEVWTRIESRPEMSPREFLFLMTIFIPTVILMTTKAILAVPKCLVGGDTSCASVAEWKENILCRIQGPGEGNSRQVFHVRSQVLNEWFNPNFCRSGGYMDDAIPKTDDNYVTVKMKLRAQSVYSSLTVVLNSDWMYQNSYAAIATLSGFERAVNRVGLGLYGVNWVIANKGCGVNGKAYVLCGDKGGQLQPTACA